MMESVIWVAVALLVLNFLFSVGIFLGISKNSWSGMDLKLTSVLSALERLERLFREEFLRGREESGTNARQLREEVSLRILELQDSLLKRMAEVQAMQKSQLEVFSENLREGMTSRISALVETQKERLDAVAKEIATMSLKQENTQENLRKSMEERLDFLREENGKKLENIRQTVDEQLQGTLEKRLGESFRLVSDRLEQVHRGLGEMQSLASGVGDLKRVLTNVKTRGTWGEVQLGSLLEQVLTPDQFYKDVSTKPGSQERVEYAIRLPGKGDGDLEVLLPLDAKFPMEDYERLLVASEKGDFEAVEIASKNLELRIRNNAKEIRDKYVNPPLTTDFAFLFLPTEGLYAEVLRKPGMIDQIQREFRITIAGPGTLAATLNALQMGFRTLAIQKRSGEVWGVLEAVKTEFGRYGAVLEKVQKKLVEASKTIDEVSVRKRAIDRKLVSVGSMSEEKAESLLGIKEAEDLDFSQNQQEV